MHSDCTCSSSLSDSHCLHCASCPQAQKRAPWRLWVQAQCSWQEGDARGGLKAQLQALLAALEAQQAQQDGASSAGPSSTAAGTAAAGSAFFPAPASTAGGGTSVAARQEARRAEQLGVIVGLPSSEELKGLLEGLEAADKLRLAGNAAVKAGKAAEAVTKYSEALQGEPSLREVGSAKWWRDLPGELVLPALQCWPAQSPVRA